MNAQSVEQSTGDTGRDDHSDRGMSMKVLFIISTDDAETSYNAVRLANVAVKNGDDVSMFMLGKGVLFEQHHHEPFNVMQQLQQFEGDFYV
jgi:uncharacterized protein involved in oxidation of intracellular sulfur